MFQVSLGENARAVLLDAAGLAPSLRNTRPWRFDVVGNTVHVYRDLDRWLRGEDPRKSALYISLGAAVFNLRVAAAELGRLARVALLPDPADPDHVAQVSLALGLGTDAELAALFPYLARRPTSRMPLADRRIPERALLDLANAAVLGGVRLQVVPAALGTPRVRELAVLSTRRDDPIGWLHTGQALQRVLLTAARWGLSVSFLDQALDDDPLRWLARDPTNDEAHSQMLLGLGYAG